MNMEDSGVILSRSLNAVIRPPSPSAVFAVYCPTCGRHYMTSKHHPMREHGLPHIECHFCASALGPKYIEQALEWNSISSELIAANGGRPVSAFDVTSEQRKRRKDRGEKYMEYQDIVEEAQEKARAQVSRSVAEEMP